MNNLKAVRFFWVLLWCLGWQGAWSASSKSLEKQLNQQRKALKGLEKELSQQRRKLRTMETEEKGVLNMINLLGQNLGQTREYLEELARTQVMLETSIAGSQDDISRLQKEIVVQEKVMHQRVRELYIQGRRAEWEHLLTLLQKKQNPDRSWVQVQRLLKMDQQMVQRYLETLKQKKDLEFKLRQRWAELTEVKKRKREESSGLQKQIDHQEQSLTLLRHDQTLHRKALNEYEQNQKTMLALIRALQQKKKKAEKEEKRRAALARKKKTKIARKPSQQKSLSVGPKCVPLKGPLLAEYGFHRHEILKTLTRNLGVEIQAKRGTPVKSAADGVVVHVAEIDGRGPSVILDHGGVYTVYGHLRRIKVKVGQSVKHCQEIAEASNASSANGSKLYFQVSEGTQTLDPMEWLKTSK